MISKGAHTVYIYIYTIAAIQRWYNFCRWNLVSCQTPMYSERRLRVFTLFLFHVEIRFVGGQTNGYRRRTSQRKKEGEGERKEEEEEEDCPWNFPLNCRASKLGDPRLFCHAMSNFPPPCENQHNETLCVWWWWNVGKFVV